MGAREEVAGRVDSPSSQTTSRFGGAVGAILLVAVLFVLVLGVYGAVYMDAFRPTPMQPAPASVATAPVSVTPAPTVASVPSPAPRPISPSVAIPPAPSLGQINPAASRSAPAPIEAAKPVYWVEYGAYDRPFYATKLVERLAAAGIRTEIKRVPGVGGRRYYSVRSTLVTDRVGAESNLKLAAARIGIAPLLHRGGGASQVKPIVAKPVAAVMDRSDYWVQFAAYDRSGYAVALRDRLAHAGIDATIVERHVPGQARYLVRSAASLRRDEARSLATRGESLLGIAPLVGRTLPSSRSGI